MEALVKAIFRIFIGFLILVVFAGCKPPPAQPSSPTAPDTPASAASPLPSKTASATAPAALSPSATPVPTEAANGRINPQNAAEVTQWRRLGQGMVSEAPFYSADGELLVIPTTLGVDLYAAQTLRKLNSIPQPSGEGLTRVPASPHLVALSPDRRYLAAALRAVAFSPNGDLQEENMQQSISLLDLDQGTIAWEKPVGWETILTDLAFSPDGQSLAVGFYPGKVQLWSVSDGGERFTFQGSTLEFSPDGSALATMPWGVDDNRRLYAYSTGDGSLLKQWEGERATFSPGGSLAIENAGAVRLVDIQKNQVLQAFNGKSAVFSADGQSLALLDRDQIKLYAVSSGELLQTLDGSFEAVTKMQFAPDGRSLAILGNAPMCPNCMTAPQAAIWQLPDGRYTVVDIQDPLWLTYAPNEGNLLIWAVEGIHVFDPNTAALAATFDEYGTNLDGVAFSPDGKTLAANSGSPHLTTRFWGIEDGQLEKAIEDPNNPGYGAGKVSFSPDGQFLWAQGSFWRVKDGARWTGLETALEKEAPSYFPASVSFSPDGKTLAIGYLEGRLQLWDLGEEKLIRKLEGFQGEVQDLAFSPDGRTLAAVYGYPDFAIQLWDVPEGRRLLSIKGVEWTHEFSQVVFSPDGQTLASVAKNEDGMDLGTVELWRAADGERLYQLEVAGAMSVAFSKDGNTLTTGSYDHTVRLWRLADGALLKILYGHGDSVTDLAFSPSGDLLASSSYDGTVILWAVPPGP
jgi:WD40 repeat protein